MAKRLPLVEDGHPMALNSKSAVDKLQIMSVVNILTCPYALDIGISKISGRSHFKKS